MLKCEARNAHPFFCKNVRLVRFSTGDIHDVRNLMNQSIDLFFQVFNRFICLHQDRVGCVKLRAEKSDLIFEKTRGRTINALFFCWGP